MDKSKYGLMREDLKLNDPVSITLPAHVWIGYLCTYAATDWSSSDASAIMTEVQEALFDPLWLKEQQAANQRHQDMHQQFMSHVIPGLLGPKIPPDAGSLSGDDS